MKVYSTILQGSEAEIENAIAYAQGFDFSESELKENTETIHDRNYIDTVCGIDIYHNWKADYYFFAPNTEQEETDPEERFRNDSAAYNERFSDYGEDY